MATHIVTAFSSLSDPLEAFKAAAIDAKGQLNTVSTDLVLVFATEPYAIAAGLDALHKILQPKRLVGSLTPGVMLGDRIEMRGVGLMAIVSNDLHFGAASVEQISLLPARDAGHGLGMALLKDHKLPQRSACLYLYDGLRKNGSHICAGIREALGSGLPTVGAVGLDGPKASCSKYFHQARVLNDAAVGLLIGGASIVCAAARQSWQPLGKPRIIDTAKGNIISTIDKQPAASLYNEYFQNTASQGAATEKLNARKFDDIRMLYPLGIGTATPKEYLIRMPIDMPDDGSIVCQGDVQTGSRAHLMITDKDGCRKNMQELAMDVREQLLGKQPKFVLVLESFMRRKILGRNAVQGLHILRETLGGSVPILGMYTLGEAAPLRSGKNIGHTQMLNGSLTVLAIG